MEKFWQWMIKNDYCELEYYYEELDVTYHGYFIPNTRAIEFSNTSLIGYMIEYLREKGKFVGMSSNKGFETIQEYFLHLKEEIEFIDKDK